MTTIYSEKAEEQYVGQRFGKLTITGITKASYDDERYCFVTRCDCGCESNIQKSRILPEAAISQNKNKMRACEKCTRNGYVANIQINENEYEEFTGLSQPVAEKQIHLNQAEFDSIRIWYPDFVPAIMYKKNKNLLEKGTKISKNGTEFITYKHNYDDEKTAIIRCGECQQIFESSVETIQLKMKKCEEYNCHSHKKQTGLRKKAQSA